MLFSTALEEGAKAPSICEIARRIDKGESFPVSYYRRYSPEHLKAVLVKALSEIYLFYGADEVSAVRQIQQLLIAIDQRYWHLTPYDIQLFAERAMAGDYGKVYGKLSPAVLSEWLKDYCRERDEEIVSFNINEQYRFATRHDRDESTTARLELDRLASKVPINR